MVGLALRVVGNEPEVGASPNTGKRLRKLNTRECEQLKKTFFGYDIFRFYIEFHDWLVRTGGEISKEPGCGVHQLAEKLLQDHRAVAEISQHIGYADEI